MNDVTDNKTNDLEGIIKQAAHDIYKNINTAGYTEKKIKQIIEIARAERQVLEDQEETENELDRSCYYCGEESCDCDLL